MPALTIRGRKLLADIYVPTPGLIGTKTRVSVMSTQLIREPKEIIVSFSGDSSSDAISSHSQSGTV